MAGGGGEDRRSVAAKLFAIADAFEGGRPLTLTEIAQRSGLPLSTTHRLVAEWVEWGGLVRGDDGRYEVGMRLWRIGVRRPSTRRLRVAALPYLEELLESTREHVHLAVRDDLAAIYLERRSGHDAVPIVSDVGSRLPLHATGVGLALLAYAPTGGASTRCLRADSRSSGRTRSRPSASCGRGWPRSARPASRAPSRS